MPIGAERDIQGGNVEDNQVAKKSTKSKVVTIDRRAQSERRKATDRRSKDKDVNVERRKIEIGSDEPTARCAPGQ